jgi:protein arginine kinase
VTVDELVKHPGLWLSEESGEGIVVSSRVRLARNLQGASFPGWAREDERVKVCEALRAALEKVSGMAGGACFDMGAISDVDKEVLKERHLISHDLCRQGAGSALVMTRDERMAVMINEEDHLRLQAIMGGMSLRRVWKMLDALDSELDRDVRYAFSPRLGYLTACPSNVGTGLRASVMMHLSGLRLLNEADAVIRGLERIGLAVRGLLGEGTEAFGNMFQISNQATLGEREDDIIERLIKVVTEVTRHELNARARLLEGKRKHLLDHIGRALGVLANARILASTEAVDMLAALRLGVDLKLLCNLTTGDLNEILLLTQPGHLQKIYSREISAEERDEIRALAVRQRVRGATLTE